MEENNTQTTVENDSGLLEGVTPAVEDNKTDEGQTIPSNTAKAPEGQQQTFEAPEALANKDFWDSEKGQLKTDLVVEELNRQTKRADDLRQKLSKGLQVPENAEGYEFKAAEGLDIVIDTKAEIFGDIKGLALKNNMTNEQLNGFINGYMQLMLDKGLIKKPMSEEEQKAAHQQYIAEQRSILGNKADTIIQSAVSFIESQYRKGIFNETEMKNLKAFADKSAVNVKIINKLREMAGGPVIPVDNSTADGLPTDKEIMEKWGTMSDSEKIKVLEQRQKLGRPVKILE